MKVKYRSYEFGTLPMLAVVLRHTTKTYPIYALVDSGAGDSLFSIDVAHALDIDLTKCAERVFYGIGEVEITGHVCNIELKIPIFDEWIKIEAGFAPNQFPLIGHEGFFENYEITFRTYQDSMEIKRKPGRKTPRLRPKRLRN